MRVLVVALVVWLVAGCKQRENLTRLKALNESLTFSNSMFIDHNEIIYNDMRSKLNDPVIANVAKVWWARMQEVKKTAGSIKAMIDDLKRDLMKNGDAVVKAQAEPDSKGLRLLNRLIQFKDSIPLILSGGPVYDSTHDYSFSTANINELLKSIPLLKRYTNRLKQGQRDQYKVRWLKENFPAGPAVIASTMLSKIEHDVRATEYAMITSCNNHVGYLIEPYTKYSAIATLSSNYVKRGQHIEVYAGMFAFYKESKPNIFINGKEISLNNEHVALDTIVATGQPGKYTVPVIVNWTGVDGTKMKMTRKLEYTIAQ